MSPRFQRARAAPALALCGALLAACGGGEPEGIAPVEGFAGIVAGDEPRAVVVGRDVLGTGGNAVDAAVAMYFAMAVTMPSRAGLGSGGACVVFDRVKQQGEAIEFLPRATPSGGVVPASMRAMAVLHARYGRTRWEQLIAPAETLARFGHAVSRAFATDLAAAAETIEANPELRSLFAARSGRLAQTGDRIEQPALSTVLGGIRQQGAGYLHGGPFARRLAQASTAAGLPLTADDIRLNLPQLVPAVEVRSGKDVAFSVPSSATGSMPSGAETAGFVVGDQYSNAVACSFTMNRLFGSGRLAGGTGILLAAPQEAAGDVSTGLNAVVVGNANTGDVRFAGTAGSGGPAAATLTQVMRKTREEGVTLSDAMGVLATRGTASEQVNALHCPDGLQDEPESCRVATDPRGFGLAVTVQ